jgi:DedD protein
MAFFKSRSAKDAAPRQTDSIEAMRKRARHRLIGATVLVVIGVIGFPLVFDNQPRPIPVDIPIEIPDRNQAKPLPVPAPVAAPVASARVTPAPVQAAVPQPKAVAQPPVAAVQAPVAAPPAAAPEVKAEAKPAKPQPKAAEPKVESKAEARPEAKPEPKVAAAPAADNGSKAKALLEASTATPAAAEGRYVVQVGAFADPAKAREARARVERAGLKTYTHVAETKAGKRIRVRVGPFPTRSEADKAASKIKGLNLPAAILTL